MKKTIKDYELKNKKVIIRCDFNVPMQDGIITDDTRIKKALETINYALKKKAKVILLSHLGKVKKETDKQQLSLESVALRLSLLLKKEVKFIPSCIGFDVETAIENMQVRDIVLLENTRFMDLDDKKESTNNKELGAYWASLGDLFINDAFGTVHRAHASNVGIASHIPSGIGFLVENELKKLSITNNPTRPYMVVMGGAKISDKLALIENILTKADKVLIAGAMANTFIKALGYEVGKSLYEESYIEYCQKLLANYPDKIIIPTDVTNGLEYNSTTTPRISSIKLIRANEMVLDIGLDTIDEFKSILNEANTIMLNGPLGVFEFDKFNKGTKQILEYLITVPAKVIIGGGDSVAAVNKFCDSSKFYHVSTGGGASLSYLEGKVLPGVDIINEK